MRGQIDASRRTIHPKAVCLVAQGLQGRYMPAEAKHMGGIALDEGWKAGVLGSVLRKADGTRSRTPHTDKLRLGRHEQAEGVIYCVILDTLVRLCDDFKHGGCHALARGVVTTSKIVDGFMSAGAEISTPALNQHVLSPVVFADLSHWYIHTEPAG